MKSIKRITHAQDVQVAPGFKVKRPIPMGHAMSEFSPFLLLDHFGPRKVDPAMEEFVPPHPHSGFQPVSLIFRGKVGHKDTLGNDTVITSGGAQWLTAGSGLMHSELFGVDSMDDPVLHGVQLWINLPKEKKKIEPGYVAINPSDVTEFTTDNATFRLFAGTLSGHAGPASTHSELLIAHVRIDKSGLVQIPIDRDWTAMIYHLAGNSKDGNQYDLIEYSGDDDLIELEVDQGAELLLLAGEPLNEKVVAYGPFVANSSVEIWEAMHAFEAGEMGELQE